LGFAVVSDEVRNLATRSSTESQKIHAVIENAVKEAEYGISVTDSTHESFKDILKTVENTMSVISEVTLSSNEQKEAVEQIKVAMSEVDLVTQNLAMNSAEISSSAESLSEQVKQTNNIVKNIHQMI
jgi:methyl-accepting chemotaxis protein